MEELRAIAGWISENYGTARKIVEVGVGKIPIVAAELRRLLPDCELLVTDIEEPPELPSGIKFARADVTEPDLSIYEGADLIYAIHPPPELQPHLTRVAREVAADLLLKLTGDEEAPEGQNLVNYRGAAFHLLKPR